MAKCLDCGAVPDSLILTFQQNCSSGSLCCCDSYLCTRFFSWGYVNIFCKIPGPKYLCVGLLFFFCFVIILWFVYFISFYKESTFCIAFLCFSNVLHFIFIQNHICGHSHVGCRGTIESEESYKSVRVNTKSN